MAGNFRIDINTSTLVATADRVKNINDSLDTKLADINKKMNDLENDWLSDAATDIRTAMNALKPRFARYKSIVESYEKFLRNTAQAYESTESAVQTNASAFK